MSIGATEAITATTTSSTSSTAGPSNGLTVNATSDSSDKEMFLQLLVAQMKYQDPTNPTDSSQFLAQSAQFTALEKMQAVADQTGLLLGAQMAFGASSLVGRTVSYELDDGTTGSGTVSSVDFGAKGPVLHIGDTEVPIANVLSVTDGSGSS